MKNHLILLLIGLIQFQSHAQEVIFQSYDLQTKTYDTLSLVSYDTLITEDKSSNYIGSFSNQTSILPSETPTENLIPNSQWTYRKPASQIYDLMHYPTRTVVKGFKLKNDTLNDNCTGTMISEKHVLLSAHCIASFLDNYSINYDSLLFCPAYDEGEVSNFVGCSYVKKIFFPLDYNLYETDIAVLELDEPLGNETGWISIGFQQDDTFFEDNIFHKFSYPASYVPFLDSFPYNGDTLYYGYGRVDIIFDYTLAINGTVAIPGESGSSLIHLDEVGIPTSYGILNFSNNQSHVRIRNSTFYPILEILKNSPSAVGPTTPIEITIFPNPTVDQVFVESEYDIEEIQVYDVSGNFIVSTEESTVFLGDYAEGVYFIRVKTDGGDIVKKVIKGR